MQYRSLGQTGLRISEIGLGCASFWGMHRFDETEAVRLVHAAIDQGVTFFDTGPSYSGGNAESRLGRALAPHAMRKDLVVATKAGSRIDRYGRRIVDFSPAGVRDTLEHSLVRLGIDAISLLQLHGPVISDLTDELLGTLESLRSEGKVLHLGVNSFDDEVMRHVMAMPTFGAVMIDYSVLSPPREQLITELAARGFGILAGQALGGALFRQDRYRIRSVQDLWYLARAWKNHRPTLRRGRRFSFINQDETAPASQIALAWVLRRPEITCAVFGTTRMNHLLENIQASGKPLTGPQLRAIETVRSELGR
jgi:aryl-alcohol dehydrogenase-like predicted oxidoreductase